MGDYVLCRNCGSYYDSDENGAGACSFHPKLSVNIGDAGARFDHADLFTFPCCGTTVRTDIVEGGDVRPPQAPGCVQARHTPETGWRVFLSYTRVDEEIVRDLEHELRRRGHRVWRDRSDLTGGEEWARAIEQAIAEAEHFLLIVTRASTVSVQVERELNLALDQGKNVVPILIEDAQIPARIKHLNCVDWRRKIDNAHSFFARQGFNELRAAIVFGSTRGAMVQRADMEAADEAAYVRRHAEQQARAANDGPRQLVIVKDNNGHDVLGQLQPAKRYEWRAGHMVSVAGVVYVVVNVISHSPNAVELLVTRSEEREPEDVSDQT